MDEQRVREIVREEMAREVKAGNLSCSCSGSRVMAVGVQIEEAAVDWTTATRAMTLAMESLTRERPLT
jgi:hypothetical protein